MTARIRSPSRMPLSPVTLSTSTKRLVRSRTGFPLSRCPAAGCSMRPRAQPRPVSVVDDWQAAEGAAAHQGDGLLDGRIFEHGTRGHRHDIADRGGEGIAALGDDADRQIAIGHNAERLLQRIEDDADAEAKVVEVLARAAQEIRKS